ncbi:MAG TPA: DMT family transporter [Candidatus Saccharimonadales bacterium]|nr:DMT family transporter [Candidatus Saccharimonadales bacterium]
MNTNVVAVLFGLAVAVGYGVADYWGARAAKKVGAVTSLVGINLVMLALYVAAYAFLPGDKPALTAGGLGFAVGGSLLLNTASILFFKGLVVGPVSLVSPISAAYPLFSVLLAVLLGTRLSGLQVGAIVVIVAGVMTAAGLFNASTGKKRALAGPTLAAASAVFYGTGFSCMAQASTRIGWQPATLVEFVVLGVSVLAAAPLVAPHERVFKNLGKSFRNVFVLAGGVVAVLTIATFNLGFTHEHTGGAITIAVSACYPAITVVLALRHFKEKVRPLQLAGAAVSIAGVILLSLG